MPLRRLEKGDLKLILAWRNSDVVRLNMLSQEPIQLEQHYRWFESMQGDDSAVWLLYTDISGEASGVVYFTDIDTFKGVSFWGFYVSPEARKGTGSRMCKEALDIAFSKLSIRKVYGEVLEFNRCSHRIHEKLGFTSEDWMKKRHQLNGGYYDVIRYRLTKEKWQSRSIRDF